ncbi:MAG: hypothetical protein M0002_03695 [Rhodospirillales bacterium]|nr:hypothetical protein [Rhodospirillales bacterium]
MLVGEAGPERLDLGGEGGADDRVGADAFLLERVHNPGGGGADDLVISAYGCTNLAATLVIGGWPTPANPGRRVFAGHVVLGSATMLIALVAATPLPPAPAVAGFAAAAARGAIGGPLHDIPIAVLRQTDLPRAEVPAAMRAHLATINLGALITMLAAPAFYAAMPLPVVMAGAAASILAIGVVGMARFAAPRAAIGRA